MDESSNLGGQWLGLLRDSSHRLVIGSDINPGTREGHDDFGHMDGQFGRIWGSKPPVTSEKKNCIR